MRSGPHPLPVHIGLAAYVASDIRGYAANFPSLSLPEDVLTHMMRGIKMYKEHPYQSDRKPLTAFWHKETLSLYRYVPDRPVRDVKAPPLLLVPSLVNRSTIFNLSQQRSFMAWMEEQGIPVYLLDWGTLYPACKDITLDQVVLDLLAPALSRVAQVHGQVPDILGYCMGGTLALALGVLRPREVGRMVLLATPWDFHAPCAPLSERIRVWSPYAQSVIEARGCLPALWTQALFASVDPEGAVQKFIRFSEMDQASDEAKLFVDVEDWLNDGVDLPAHIAQHCMQNWYAKNLTMKNEWSVAGCPIDLAEMEKDIMIIASHKDKLVPFSSAANVRNTLVSSHVTMNEAHCGHVSFIAGKNAVEKIWTPLAQWLLKK